MFQILVFKRLRHIELIQKCNAKLEVFICCGNLHLVFIVFPVKCIHCKATFAASVDITHCLMYMISKDQVIHYTTRYGDRCESLCKMKLHYIFSTEMHENWYIVIQLHGAGAVQCVISYAKSLYLVMHANFPTANRYFQWDLIQQSAIYIFIENNWYTAMAVNWYYVSVYYRSGTVNSKSFVGKVLLWIKWKFELNSGLKFKFWPNFE